MSEKSLAREIVEEFRVWMNTDLTYADHINDGDYLKLGEIIARHLATQEAERAERDTGVGHALGWAIGFLEMFTVPDNRTTTWNDRMADCREALALLERRRR